jgi:hypothetical protein
MSILNWFRRGLQSEPEPRPIQLARLLGPTIVSSARELASTARAAGSPVVPSVLLLSAVALQIATIRIAARLRQAPPSLIDDFLAALYPSVLGSMTDELRSSDNSDMAPTALRLVVGQIDDRLRRACDGLRPEFATIAPAVAKEAVIILGIQDSPDPVLAASLGVQCGHELRAALALVENLQRLSAQAEQPRT